MLIKVCWSCRPGAMAGYREGIADNALDACDSSRRCNRRYTASIRGPHADPPRVFSAFLRHLIQTDANWSVGDSPRSLPRSRHPDGWREREGSSPRVTPICGSSARSLSSGSNHWVVTPSTARLPSQGLDQHRQSLYFQGFRKSLRPWLARFVDQPSQACDNFEAIGG